MSYLVVGKKGMCAMVAGLCLCIIASVAVANGLGKAIFVSGEKRQLPIYSVETEEKVVALGFNCAWDDADVPVILTILEQNEVKATFFMVGQWAEKYPDSVKAIYDAGHELGNHSYSHPDMTTLTKEKALEQIQKCDDAIEKITGVRPKLFRPPSGAYNNTVMNAATELGHSVIQWDCDSLDWKNPTPDEMQRRLMKNVCSGSITLFHVGKQNTVQALPLIIAQLKEQGYALRPVGKIIHYGGCEMDAKGRQHKVK